MSNPVTEVKPVIKPAEPDSPASARSNRSRPEQDVKHTSMNLKKQIEKDDAQPLSLSGVVAYELRMAAVAIPPIILVTCLALVTFYPFFEYARQACDDLESADFEPDQATLDKLQLVNDDRFVVNYGVQEQMGQLYDGVLPSVPQWLFTMILFVPFCLSVGFVVAASVASPPALVDGAVMAYAQPSEGIMLQKWIGAVGLAVVILVQGAKALGKISSKMGSFGTLVILIPLQYAIVRALRNAGSDLEIPKAILICTDLGALGMIVVNQYILKKATTDLSLAIIWAVWCLWGEFVAAYFRSKIRTLDLARCDPKWIPFGLVPLASTVNCAKRIPLLGLTGYDYIIALNIISCVVEVINRTTVLRRDRAIDMCFGRKSAAEAEEWKEEPMRRQVYLHCEMVQEMLELVYPLPMTVLLYMLQFSPQGEVVLLAPMLTNGVLQIVQELVADCVALYYGSRHQRKFYRTAFSNLFTPAPYIMCHVMIGLSSVAVLGLFFLQYVRVGKTGAGDYVSLI